MASSPPDIDMIGVLKLCAIPPIICPRDASLSLSIATECLSVYFLSKFELYILVITKDNIKPINMHKRPISTRYIPAAVIPFVIEETGVISTIVQPSSVPFILSIVL
ncbi:MAG: hypothetical protein BWY74_01907 [Firmicutes bacterium ADurb.Bin419]|nr:MAG: hypothetical protein BWY74_01907 [Firmicutes bacterium ADurb.Bin419]